MIQLNPGATLRSSIHRAARLLARPGRTVRWPAALGALLLAASTASVVATANSAPQFYGIRASTTVAREGQTVTLVGGFEDPDAGDGHTLLVYWHGGDGEENQELKQKILLPPGQSTFEVSHVYADNFPPQPIKVVVFDHELPFGSNDNTTGGMLSDAEFLPIEVRNVEPTFVESSVTIQKLDRRRVVVEGDVVDPGTADRLQVFATWSDRAAPETTVCSLSNGDRHFRCEHTYPAPAAFGVKKTYTIGLIVKDDDGGFDQHETKVQLP